jgi:excisionase family DNA binding protein
LLRLIAVAAIKVVQWVDAEERRMAEITLVPTLPSEAEEALAKESSHVLAARKSPEPLRLRLLDDPSCATITLPASAVLLLVRILEEMGRGHAVTLIPVHAELTTQEAADLLHISRPSLIELLQQGKIQFRKVGKHRRVRFDDLMAYKRRAELDRRSALEQLTAYDQELGL